MRFHDFWVKDEFQMDIYCIAPHMLIFFFFFDTHARNSDVNIDRALLISLFFTCQQSSFILNQGIRTCELSEMTHSRYLLTLVPYMLVNFVWLFPSCWDLGIGRGESPLALTPDPCWINARGVTNIISVSTNTWHGFQSWRRSRGQIYHAPWHRTDQSEDTGFGTDSSLGLGWILHRELLVPRTPW